MFVGTARVDVTEGVDVQSRDLVSLHDRIDGGAAALFELARHPTKQQMAGIPLRERCRTLRKRGVLDDYACEILAKSRLSGDPGALTRIRKAIARVRSDPQGTLPQAVWFPVVIETSRPSAVLPRGVKFIATQHSQTEARPDAPTEARAAIGASGLAAQWSSGFEELCTGCDAVVREIANDAAVNWWQGCVRTSIVRTDEAIDAAVELQGRESDRSFSLAAAVALMACVFDVRIPEGTAAIGFVEHGEVRAYRDGENFDRKCVGMMEALPCLRSVLVAREDVHRAQMLVPPNVDVYGISSLRDVTEWLSIHNGISFRGRRRMNRWDLITGASRAWILGRDPGTLESFLRASRKSEYAASVLGALGGGSFSVAQWLQSVFITDFLPRTFANERGTREIAELLAAFSCAIVLPLTPYLALAAGVRLAMRFPVGREVVRYAMVRVGIRAETFLRETQAVDAPDVEISEPIEASERIEQRAAEYAAPFEPIVGVILAAAVGNGILVAMFKFWEITRLVVRQGERAPADVIDWTLRLGVGMFGASMCATIWLSGRALVGSAFDPAPRRYLPWTTKDGHLRATAVAADKHFLRPFAIVALDVFFLLCATNLVTRAVAVKPELGLAVFWIFAVTGVGALWRMNGSFAGTPWRANYLPYLLIWRLRVPTFLVIGLSVMFLANAGRFHTWLHRSGPSGGAIGVALTVLALSFLHMSFVFILKYFVLHAVYPKT